MHMINTINHWIKRLKSSSIVKPFIAIKNWYQENVIKRKLLIFTVLFIAWVGLLLGAVTSPERQTYTDDQLKTTRSFENGTGEMVLTSQKYSPKTGIIVLQFETQDDTSSVDRGIDATRLKWKLYAQTKTDKTSMEVIPTVDNKISVIIREVPKNFGAFAIDVTNTTVSSSSIDVDISTSSDDEESTAQSSTSKEDSTVQFFVTTQNKNLKQETIKDVSREDFALSEIKEEISYQKGQLKKLNQSITKLKSSIEDDESRKDELKTEAKYLTGDDLEANQKGVAAIDSSIETKNQSIETATDNVEKLKGKIESLNKKKLAIEDGTFEFSNPIETIEMN